MAEFRETVGENTQTRALLEALARIKDRSQQHFANPLEVKYCDPYEGPMMPHPFYYVAEVKTERWLGIIPKRKQRMVFVINPGFYGGAYGKKEINCGIFDRSILDIVKEEVQKYADAFQATAVNLTQDFAR